MRRIWLDSMAGQMAMPKTTPQPSDRVNEENSSLDSLEITLQKLNDDHAKELISVMVTLGLLMVVGIIGNSLVLYVYWRWSKMKITTKRIFIITLAILDLTVCTVVIPFEIYDLRNHVLFQNLAACKAARVFEYSIVLSSGFVLVSVSVERYVYICKAFRKFSKRKAKIICICCVIISFVVGGPSATFAGIKKTKLENSDIYGFECSMDSADEDAKASERIYYYFLSVIFLACICILIVIYSIIWALLRKYQKALTRNTSSVFIDKNELDRGSPQIAQNGVAKENRSCSADSTVTLRLRPGQKAFKSPVSIIVFFSVTVTFLASFLPHIIIRFLQFSNVHFDDLMHQQTSELLYNFLIRSYLVGNVSNPFIYSILNKAFRLELKRCFKKVVQRDKFEHRKTYLIDL